jgi:hypothetical protein
MRAHVLEAVTKRVAALNAARTRAPISAPPLPEDYDHLTLYRGVLRAPEGEVSLQKIGEGAFARVYREVGGKGRVFAFTDDDTHDKEIASMASSPDNPHVPAVEKYGHTVGYGPTGQKTVYTMPYYKAPLRKSDSPRAWADFRVIEKCLKESDKYGRGLYETNTATVECVRTKGATPGVADALGDLVDTAANYDADEFALEIAPRNLATDDKGNLVLLDVLFNRRKRREQLEAADKRREERATRELRNYYGRGRGAW